MACVLDDLDPADACAVTSSRTHAVVNACSPTGPGSQQVIRSSAWFVRGQLSLPRVGRARGDKMRTGRPTPNAGHLQLAGS
eukprot:10909140-Alexandrium_andersonii.AAC.1